MLDVSKTIQESDIPIKIIMANENFVTEAICICFSKSLENCKFPNYLKLTNITPVFKKGICTYRSVSILPVFSKSFERLLSRKLSGFFDNIESKFQCGFRKDYETHDCLISMHEIWEGATDNNKSFGTLLTYLSKDCLSHDLSIAKLYTYGYDIDLQNILQDYLSNRKQKTTVNPFYGSWEATFSGVSQDSLLGSLLLKRFMCDMFLILKTTYFTGYADDNTPFVVRDNLENVIKALEEIGEDLSNLVLNNEMKLKYR